MNKHTPGPWGAIPHKTSGGLPWWSVGGGYHGEIICDLGRVNSIDEEEANARLIAAAPDLLAALEALERACIPDQDPIIMLAATERARAAIAKATGGES